RGGQAKSMSGSIEEIPLPDLMQLLGSSKKSGVLVIRSDDDVGRIYLRKGVVTFATINELEDVQPLKAVFRILTWSKGPFDLEPWDERELPGEINASVQELLMEGLRQIDELNAIRHKLPSLEARLVLSSPLRPALRDLEGAELDVLQLALNYG